MGVIKLEMERVPGWRARLTDLKLRLWWPVFRIHHTKTGYRKDGRWHRRLPGWRRIRVIEEVDMKDAEVDLLGGVTFGGMIIRSHYEWRWTGPRLYEIERWLRRKLHVGR